jgi:hypothetical protein
MQHYRLGGQAGVCVQPLFRDLAIVLLLLKLLVACHDSASRQSTPERPSELGSKSNESSVPAERGRLEAKMNEAATILSDSLLDGDPVAIAGSAQRSLGVLQGAVDRYPSRDDLYWQAAWQLIWTRSYLGKDAPGEELSLSLARLIKESPVKISPLQVTSVARILVENGQPAEASSVIERCLPLTGLNATQVETELRLIGR